MWGILWALSTMNAHFYWTSFSHCCAVISHLLLQCYALLWQCSRGFYLLSCSEPITCRQPCYMGADPQTLLYLYRSLIRSKLGYGCVVYGFARRSYLRMLDPDQNHALRLCLGAYLTSPSSSLCVLANEPHVYLRHKSIKAACNSSGLCTTWHS